MECHSVDGGGDSSSGCRYALVA
eukprot:COSAG04_NODE_8731_length_937_cov_2.005967_1_plen_22_part_10